MTAHAGDPRRYSTKTTGLPTVSKPGAPTRLGRKSDPSLALKPMFVCVPVAAQTANGMEPGMDAVTVKMMFGNVYSHNLLVPPAPSSKRVRKRRKRHPRTVPDKPGRWEFLGSTAVLGHPGLGSRDGIQEVDGSIPFSSTNRTRGPNLPEVCSLGSSSLGSSQRNRRCERRLLLVLPPGRADRFSEQRDLRENLARPRPECRSRLRSQLLYGDCHERYPACSGGGSQGVLEQRTLGLVHTEVHGEDLIHAPIGHRVAHQHRTGYDLMLRRPRALHHCSHLSGCDLAGTFHAALDDISRGRRSQMFRGVIGLFGPPRIAFLDELNSPPINNVQIAAGRAEHDKRRPPRVRFQTKNSLHRSNLAAKF
jgi:hypothetical protein